MAKNVGKGKGVHPPAGEGDNQISLGIQNHYGKPRPLNLLKPGGQNGPVKITKKANKESI